MKPSLARVASLLATMLTLAGCSDGGSPERIVLIVVDTLRRDHVSAYGDAAATPHIDALAARGQRLTQAVSSFHQTTMSMASLFTGRTPSLESGDPKKPLRWTGRTWCGMSRFAPAGSDEPCVPSGLATLGEEMQRGGYETIGVVSNPLLFDPAGYSAGFEAWLEVGGPHRGPGRLNPAERRAFYATHDGIRVNEQVAAALDRRRSDRVFLYVHYMDAHDYSLARGPRSYAQHVEKADAAVGTLLAMLEERGLVDGAVIVLTADHGEKLRETHPVKGGLGHRGNPSYESVMRVPLIVTPARFEDPDRPMRGEDLHRWLRGLAGLAPDEGSELEDGELFFTEMKWQTYRRGRWKSAWSRRSSTVVLFDLLEDPGETRNVADEHPDVLARHRQRIGALSARLTAAAVIGDELSEEDRQRLDALGYLDDAESPSP